MLNQITYQPKEEKKEKKRKKIFKMSENQKPDPKNTDPYSRLGIVQNDDGTLTRSPIFPNTPASSDPNDQSNNTLIALSKDVPINQSKNTWMRLYLPREALDTSPPPKLPIVVHFHGGGFILFSAASAICHDFCAALSAEARVLVVSVEYRLAPEHRLPAAYDDAVEALHCIKASPDEWLREYADPSECFLMGGSAGGNIAYRAGLRLAAEPAERLVPVVIRGMILHQPFFGGARRSGSELRLENDDVLPLCASDLMWRLALPVGVNRDHEYCNPTADEGGSTEVDSIGLLGWKVLVTGWDGDPLFDRQAEVAKMLEGKGVKLVAHFGVGGYHGIEMADTSKAKQLYQIITNFISS